MKHIERIYLGGVTITIAIIGLIYSIFTWHTIAYIVGTFVVFYAIGFLLDKIGILNRIRAIPKDDTQKYDDC